MPLAICVEQLHKATRGQATVLRAVESLLRNGRHLQKHNNAVAGRTTRLWLGRELCRGENTNFNSALMQELFDKGAITTKTKENVIFVAAGLSEAERVNLSTPLKEFVKRCSFNSRDCNPDE